MIFYRIEAHANVQLDIKLTQRAASTEKNQLRDDCRHYNQLYSDNTLFSISTLKTDGIVAVAAVKYFDSFDIHKDADKFFSFLNLDFMIEKIEEITLTDFINAVKIAADNELGFGMRFFFHDNKILKRPPSLPDDSLFDEDIIYSFTTNEELYENAKNLKCSNSLIEELDRIFSSGHVPNSGHPCHYIIISDDNNLVHSIVHLITNALLNTKRLKSRRVSFMLSSQECEEQNDRKRIFLNRENDDLDIDFISYIYSISNGSSVVIKIEDDFDPFFSEKDIIKEIKANREESLTFVVFSPKDKNLLEDFKEDCSDMRFIEFTENNLNKDEATNLLKELSEKDEIKNNASLFSSTALDQETFSRIEVKNIYDKWKKDQYPIESYPLYKNIAKTQCIQKEDLGSAYSKLQNLIGLSSVKNIVNKALDLALFQKLYPNSFTKSFNPSRHMVFAGSPGTAKTTVARLYAQIMKDNSVLSAGKLIEVGRQDLVGQYVGWTAKAVEAIFKKAEGSVLFIDEAYSLCDDRHGSFGDEAINTIVQMMENNKDNTVVIFAGYPDKMSSFLDRNPGLRSRIAFHVNFDNYSIDELMQILILNAKDSKITIDEEALTKAKSIIKEAMNNKDFGNGRFIRNLFENARINQASRLISDFKANSLNENEISRLKSCDFIMPEVLRDPSSKQKIGFAC